MQTHPYYYSDYYCCCHMLRLFDQEIGFDDRYSKALTINPDDPAMLLSRALAVLKLGESMRAYA